jgi:hypothetical protein
MTSRMQRIMKGDETFRHFPEAGIRFFRYDTEGQIKLLCRGFFKDAEGGCFF